MDDIVSINTLFSMKIDSELSRKSLTKQKLFKTC